MRHVVFAIIFCCSTGTACKREGKVTETGPALASKGTLEVKFAASKVTRGQDINLTVQLSNTSSQQLWANQRMLLNGNHAPGMMRELWLEVVGPDGAQIPFSSKVRAGEAVASDFAVLKPGQTVSKQVNLSNSFALDKPGVYQVTAHYQDGTTDLPKAPEGASHLREQLSAAPAKFELLAP
jgi:hypothetical protein